MRHLAAALLSLLLLLPSAVQARSAELVDPGPQRATTAEGHPATAEQIGNAIVMAGRLRNWRILERNDGAFLMQLDVRGKHSVMVDVSYADGNFEIRYRDSVNMNYKNKRGRALIHPNYMKWVAGLQAAIFQSLRI